MAMAEEYDDYQSWPIKWATDWVQDNIIENILPDNAYFFKGDIGPVNIHFATAIRYGRESLLGSSATFGQVKDYIRTNQGAIEFSVLIMSHVIDDLGKASNGVVYLQNSDQQLKKITKMSNSCECIPTGGRGLLQKNSKEQKR